MGSVFSRKGRRKVCSKKDIAKNRAADTCCQPGCKGKGFPYCAKHDF